MRLKAIAQPLLIGLLMILFISPAVYAVERPADKSDQPAIDPTKVTESLVINWPEKEEWIADYQYTGNNSEIQLYFPEGQGQTNWKEMATTEIVYGQTTNIMSLARQTYLGTVKGSPNATWDILKKGKTEGNRSYVIYEIICPDFISKEPPQVQIWKLIKGHTGLFTFQYSYRDKEMPDKRREQILDFILNVELKLEEKI